MMLQALAQVIALISAYRPGSSSISLCLALWHSSDLLLFSSSLCLLIVLGEH